MRGTFCGRLGIAMTACARPRSSWRLPGAGVRRLRPPSAHESKTDPKINEPFKKADVKGFIKKFESDDRELYKKRNEIVAALDLRPGMAVADIGAGTGLFTRLFAERVGPQGKGVRGRYLAEHVWRISPLKPRSGDTTTSYRPGNPRLDQSTTRVGRPGVRLRRLSSPGEAREDARIDPPGTQTRRAVGRD